MIARGTCQIYTNNLVHKRLRVGVTEDFLDRDACDCRINAKAACGELITWPVRSSLNVFDFHRIGVYQHSTWVPDREDSGR